MYVCMCSCMQLHAFTYICMRMWITSIRMRSWIKSSFVNDVTVWCCSGALFQDTILWLPPLALPTSFWGQFGMFHTGQMMPFMITFRSSALKNDLWPLAVFSSCDSAFVKYSCCCTFNMISASIGVMVSCRRDEKCPVEDTCMRIRVYHCLNVYMYVCIIV